MDSEAQFSQLYPTTNFLGVELPLPFGRPYIGIAGIAF